MGRPLDPFERPDRVDGTESAIPTATSAVDRDGHVSGDAPHPPPHGATEDTRTYLVPWLLHHERAGDLTRGVSVLY